MNFNLITMASEMTLQEVLQHEIGLYSEIVVGPGFLGINIVTFVALGKNPVMKNLLIDVTNSSITNDHVDLKKAEVKPSGPGNLYGLTLIQQYL